MIAENIYIDIQFKGKGFSPRKLMELSKLPLEIIAETGEIATKGRYKDNPLPFGLALLKLEDNPEILDIWTDKLLEIKSALEVSKVGEIIFDIESKVENLTNFSISKDLAGKLSQLNGRINFTPIREDNFEELIYKVIHHLPENLKKEELTELKNDLSRFGKLYSENQISGKMAYAVILYSLNKMNFKKTEMNSFENFIKEYSE